MYNTYTFGAKLMEAYDFLLKQADELDKKISKLPRGTVVARTVSGRRYWCHQWTESSQTRYKSIKDEDRLDIQTDIKKRKSFSAYRKRVLQDISTIEKLLGEDAQSIHKFRTIQKKADPESYDTLIREIPTIDIDGEASLLQYLDISTLF